VNRRSLSAIRWIVIADLLAVSRRRQAFLLPAVAVGVLLVIGMGIVALAGSTVGFSATVLLLSVVMSVTLSLQWVVRSAIEDGSIEQLLLAAQPRPVIIAGKVLSHWLLSGLPCIGLVVASGLALEVTPTTLVNLVLTLLVATPLISVIATLVAMRSRQDAGGDVSSPGREAGGLTVTSAKRFGDRSRWC
jgi:heme exporter protein B